MRVVKTLFVVALCLFATGFGLVDDEDIGSILKEHNVEGTVIVASLDNGVVYGYNEERANALLAPGCSFQIANHIIAIEEKLIENADDILFKWDGTEHFMDAWNRDQSVRSAFRASCVWCFQELYKKIGKENYLKYFTLLNYPRASNDELILDFFGDSVRVTALEQVDFLQRIYKKQLPVSAKSYAILKEIMLEESFDEYKVYSKTGAVTKDWVGHGWYVGYIEKGDLVWFFATNLLINSWEDLAKRKEVTMAILKKKGCIGF